MMADAAEEGPVGIRVADMTDWLVQHVPGLQPPIGFELLKGGRSNLTFRVQDASGRVLALRRPPLSDVLPSAHDMEREHRILDALAGTEVPVPRTLVICRDEAVTGAVFYVMEFVDGTVLRDAGQATEVLTSAARARAARTFVEGLAALHALSPSETGLGDLGPGVEYVTRQLTRWRRQLGRLGDRELPLLEELHRRLADAVPTQLETRLVHGDYRLANAIVDARGRLRAILDWELCTRGDPLADVGWLLVYWQPPSDLCLPALSMPTTAAGFPSREEVLDRYVGISGRDVSAVGFHVAFSYWKLAAILEGVRVRYRRGAYGDASPGSDLQETVDALAQAADEAARREGI